MALVMLPSDLPWWPTVQRKLTMIQNSSDLETILENMQKIHDLCNVSLDPDEDLQDLTIFNGFRKFIEEDFKAQEKEHFLKNTIKFMAKQAQNIKSLRPPRGLNFSLQQQSDNVELDRKFIAALLANAFFSTFPKRTEKTHPTLQDFNFTSFFNSLHLNSQKAKLRCFLYYFDWLEKNLNHDLHYNNINCKNNNGDNSDINGSNKDISDFELNVKLSRKIMTGKQWLTIEDWTECMIPLCPIDIKHQGKIESCNEKYTQTVFTSSRIGGNSLFNGNSQECLQLFTKPESLVGLLFIECLEDNEAILIEDVFQLTRIIDAKNRSLFEIIQDPKFVTLCLIDAENYSVLPVDQFEEDNILRELNKCLLGFRQNIICKTLDNQDKRTLNTRINYNNKEMLNNRNNEIEGGGRLSPIGESGSNSPSNDKANSMKIIIKQPSSSTFNSSVDSRSIDNDIERRRNWLSPSRYDPEQKSLSDNNSSDGKGSVVSGPLASGRRGRFIVLGSSGERLPIKREPIGNLYRRSPSIYKSCDSSFNPVNRKTCNNGKESNKKTILSETDNDDSDNGEDDEDEYHSAKDDSFDSDLDSDIRQYRNTNDENDMDDSEKRKSFVRQLKDALRQSSNYTDSTDESSYELGISISGSQDNESPLKLRRSGSTGFVLTEDLLDESFYKNSLAQEKQWLDKFRNKQNTILLKKDNNETSSKCSFSTDCDSEVEEVYEQFSKWLEDPVLKNELQELDPRDKAVLNFANSLLKRTLSESFVGVPLTDGCILSASLPAEDTSMQGYSQKKSKPKLTIKSLSMELAKYKHRLAAQLISQLGQKCTDKNSNLSPVATGNWGCGSSRMGDVQLKLIIQWMAASVAGLPVLIYYTNGHRKLTKLDTLIRVLRDRDWTVGELAMTTLEIAKEGLDISDRLLDETQCLFQKLIGI